MNISGVSYKKQLRFLSFGDPLHDELINGWLNQCDDLLKLGVSLFEEHELWLYREPGIYLIRLTVIDPADESFFDLENKRNAVAKAATHSDVKRLIDLMRPFTKTMRCALEADTRWLRSELPPSLKLDIRRWNNGNWIQISPEEATALLNPTGHNKNVMPQAIGLRISQKELAVIQAELSRMRRNDERAARTTWSHRFPEFKASLAERLMVIEEEGRNAIELATSEIHRAEKVLEIARERGNPGHVARAKNMLDDVADKLSMTKAYWDERTRWLRECEEQVRVAVPKERLTALIRTNKASE